MVESLEFEFGAQVSTYCDRGASEVVSRVRCLLVHVLLCMVYGVWCMVSGVWFMIYGLWFMVYGSWFMVYAL